MERIQFGQFLFDTGSYELTCEGEVIVLDPRTVSLLLFLLDNPKRIITRDELQTVIWQGVIVTDNAINKLVANLRKTLNDDPKSPQYIQTVPKQGYRFIAEASVLKGVKSHLDTDQKSVKSNYVVKGLASLLVCLLAVVLVMLNSRASSELNYNENNVLTRVMGAKRSLVVAPSGESVSFINDTRGKGNTLWVKRLNDQYDDVGTQVASGAYYIDALVAQTSTHLIFTGYQEEQCGWFKVPFAEGTRTLAAGKAQRLGCNKLVSHQFTYDTRQDVIWLLGHPKQHEHQNTLYKVDFTTGLEPINVTLPKGWQFISLDLKADSSELLLIAHNSQGISQFFTFDTTSHTLTALGRTHQQIEFGIWGHESDQVIVVSASKPTQLQSINVQKGSERTLASLTDRICCELARHPNNKDYVYSTYDKNIDLNWRLTGFELDNSNGNERLPAFANKQIGIYFTSNRAGGNHIYFQAPAQRAAQVIMMDEHMRLRELAVSPDDKLLLVNHNNHQLWIVDSERKNVLHQTSLDGYGFAQSWINNTLFAVTVKQKTSRSVRVYNRQLQLVAELPPSWMRIMPDRANREVIYVYNQDKNVYRFTLADLLNGQMQKGVQLGEVDHFHQGIVEDSVLYASDHIEAELTIYKLNDRHLQFLSQNPFDGYYGFDVKDGQLIYASTRVFSSDLYTTQAR